MPTARKTTARRTTAASKKTSTSRTAPKELLQDPILTPDQKRAKLEAYHALNEVGLPIPEDLKVVEGWIAEARKRVEEENKQREAVVHEQQERVEEANKTGPWYVRNAYNAPFNLRLDRQTEKRRIQLQPRGMPGDMHPLKDEDLKDPVLKQNMNLGVIEIIPAGEADQVVAKQTNNMSQRVHTPLQVLRNERNEAYKQGAVRVEAEYNSQGVTVAIPEGAPGELTDREIASGRSFGGLRRADQRAPQAPSDQATSVVNSQFVPTGGNPSSIRMGDDARARAVDDLARRKDLQGPAAGLGDIQVVVDPVVRN